LKASTAPINQRQLCCFRGGIIGFLTITAGETRRGKNNVKTVPRGEDNEFDDSSLLLDISGLAKLKRKKKEMTYVLLLAANSH
jgi:hypothetical protein